MAVCTVINVNMAIPLKNAKTYGQELYRTWF